MKWDFVMVLAAMYCTFCHPQTSAGAPVNDNLANATTVPAAGGTLSGTNVTATKEPAEPDHLGIEGGTSVWWKWTPGSSSRAGFSTAGTSFDTLLAIYTGASYPQTFIAGNDDEDLGSNITTSRVSFDAVAGTTYYVVVDGFEGVTGNITLQCIPVIAGPANNNLADAYLISGFSGTELATNIDANKEPNEPNLASNMGGSSVWWRWTAPSSDIYTFSTAGSSFDTLLGVYTGASFPLTSIAENDDGLAGLTSEVSFSAVSGTTYKIVVDGFDGATGMIHLNWTAAVPVVAGLTRTGASVTSAAVVSYQLSFSEAVTGVDAADLSVTQSGSLTGAAIGTISGTGSSYAVSVNSGTGDGTLRLNVVDNDTIKDSSNTPLGGAGTGNGSFNGETYTIDKTAPAVAFLEAISGSVVDLTYTEAGALVNVTAAGNYTVSGPGKGTVAANPSSVTLVSGKRYRLTWNTGSMINGQVITVTVANVQDAAGNPIGSANSASNVALPVHLSSFVVE